MPEKSVQLNEGGSVEGTLNELLEAEAQKLIQAVQYEHNEQRQGYRSDHYNRNLTTTSGDVTLKVLKLKGISLETAIIERYRCQESKKAASIVSADGFHLLLSLYWIYITFHLHIPSDNQKYH